MATGLALFAAYMLQHALGLHWQALVALQQEQLYRIGSGLLLLLLILFQWYFSRIKANPKISVEKSITHQNLHKWMGALSPVIFYLHAASPGFAYLFVLTFLFFSNLLLGLFNYEALPLKKQWFFQLWMIMHISISCLITSLILVHVAVVVYFE
jgi:methionine sulfoxide reductase heme-binding subunit